MNTTEPAIVPDKEPMAKANSTLSSDPGIEQNTKLSSLPAPISPKTRATITQLTLVTNVIRQLPLLLRYRAATRTSNIWLDALSIGSIAVCTALTLTMAGGTWMFYNFSLHFDPTAPFLQTFTPISNTSSGNRVEELYLVVTNVYFGLALFACSLTIMPLILLNAGAVRVGAFARSRRLAALRLIGADSASTRLLACVEAAIYIVIGVITGTLLWLLSLPMWQCVTMLERPLDPSQMIMPLSLLAGLLAVIAIIAFISAIFGLQSVTITPLGVSRQALTTRIRIWRLVLLLTLLAFSVLVLPRLFPYLVASRGTMAGILVVGTTLASGLGLAHLVNSLLLRSAARLLSKGGKAARMIAMHSIIADPRPAARGVAGISLMSFVATVSLFTSASVSAADVTVRKETALLLHDIRIGIIITIGVTLIIATVMTLVQQCSALYDQQTVIAAINNLGAPSHLWTFVRLHQALMPAVVACASAVVVATLLTLPVATSTTQLSFNFTWLAALIGALVLGIASLIGSTMAVSYIQNSVINSIGRRND